MAGLEGHVALVTGGSQGIGRACARALAAAGAQVAVGARNLEKLNQVVAEIEQTGGKAAAFRMDVSSEDEIKAAVKAAAEKFGKLDIVVNNAGITRDALVLRMKRADWDAVLATNLTGAHLVIQATLAGMLKQRWGRIINITSVVGEAGQAGQANYAAAKAGVIGLTLAVAREVASRNITVNAVAPGYIVTAMTEVLPAEARETMLHSIPLGRAGREEEVAAAVRFLASEEAGYITGQVLRVNGGMLMG